MNRFILFFVIFYSMCFFAQGKTSLGDSLQAKKDYFKIYVDDLLVINNTIDFKSVNVSITPFSVYNTYSKYNDVYFLHNENYYQSNSKLLLENNWGGSKIDSFNPYGAEDISSAVVLGFVNLLLDKNISFKLF